VRASRPKTRVICTASCSPQTDRRAHQPLKGLLAGQGVSLRSARTFWSSSTRYACGMGQPSTRRACPTGTRAHVLSVIHQHILELEGKRAELLRTAKDASVDKVRRLLRLCGIGENSAWLYVMEFFGWREFHNRRRSEAWRAWRPRPLIARAVARPGHQQSGNSRSVRWRLRSRGAGCAISR